MGGPGLLAKVTPSQWASLRPKYKCEKPSEIVCNIFIEYQYLGTEENFDLINAFNFKGEGQMLFGGSFSAKKEPLRTEIFFA